ncbi:MAG: DUF1320 domain-containing protein [Alphaproteobacteria bacterium]|nr:DUF1320 domain-containing protein [Alphaproteobacteria bacterium]
MAYSAQSDLVTRYGEAALLLIADRDGDGVLDAGLVADTIAGADSIIDLHVRGRYAVPLSPVPREILDISTAIARYRLYQNGNDAPEVAKEDYKAAMALLKLIADGTAVLTSAAASSSDPAATSGEVETAGDEPVFTSETLKAF